MLNLLNIVCVCCNVRVYCERCVVVFGNRFWKRKMNYFFLKKHILVRFIKKPYQKRWSFERNLLRLLKNRIRKYFNFGRNLLRLEKKPYQIIIFCYGSKPYQKMILFFGTLASATVSEPY